MPAPYASRLLILPTMLLASAALADTTNQARGYVSVAFPIPAGSDGVQQQIVEHPGLCIAAATETGGFATTGDADARTDYGYIVVNASGHGSVNSIGSGFIHDDLVFTVPGLTQFTAIEVTFSATISGSMTCSNQGLSSAVWSAGVNLNGDAFEINPFGGLNQGIPGGAPMGTYTGTATVAVGYPAPLHIELNATSATAYNDLPGDSSLNNITIVWQGISAVKRNGIPVASWSLSSASGTNWIGSFTVPPTSCPADLGSGGGVAGGDGVLDNNDFIVFITHFFSGDPAADLGSAGGVAGSDGAFDNNDFIAFITLFFVGC